MHPADISAALKKAGIRQTAIANDLDVSNNAVSLVILGRSTSKRIAKAISKATGFPLQTLWPDKYASRDSRKKKYASR